MPAPFPVDDKFEPVTRDELTDQALLPRRFDLLAGEVRQLAGDVRALPGLLETRLERLIDRLLARVDEHSRRLAVHEELHDRHNERFTKLEADLAASKQTPTRRRRTARKKR